MTARHIPVLCASCGRPYFRVHTCPAASRGFEIVGAAPERPVAQSDVAEVDCGAERASAATERAGRAITAQIAADTWRRAAEREAERADAAERDLLAVACVVATAAGRPGPREGVSLAAYAEACAGELAGSLAAVKRALRETVDERDRATRRAEYAEGRLARLVELAARNPRCRVGVALDSCGCRRIQCQS